MIKIFFLYDALFFYANKGRYSQKRFSKLWIFTAWFFGVLFFLGGIALFIYCFIEYDLICNEYLAINITLLCMASVQLIINFIKY